MEIIGILIFIFLISILSGFFVLFSYFLNSSRKGYDGGEQFLHAREGLQKVDIKFYQLTLIFLILCIQGVLLFPWMINFNRDNSWIVLSLMLVAVASYVFVWTSKGLDWKK